MKCKHCGKRTELPITAILNVDAYGGSALVAAPCCGAPYRITRKPGYDIEPAVTSVQDDDWGNPIRKRFHYVKSSIAPAP